MHQEYLSVQASHETNPSVRLIGRLPGCNYCILEYLLRPELLNIPSCDPNQLDVNFNHTQNAAKYRAHRTRVEEACSRCNLNCALKNLAMGYFEDRFLIQMKCIEIFKWDRSKKLKKAITWEEAVLAWLKEKAEDGKTYATRFGELWDHALNHFNGLTIYQLVVGTTQTYEAALALLRSLHLQAQIRDIEGL